MFKRQSEISKFKTVSTFKIFKWCKNEDEDSASFRSYLSIPQF